MPPTFRQDTPPPTRPPQSPLDTDLGAVRDLAKTAWDTGEALARDGDLQGALPWLGRAHRIAPSDQNLAFALACLRLRVGDGAGAATLFARMAARHDVRECWTGLATASLLDGRVADAKAALQIALSDHAADVAAASVAGRIVQAAGLVGWCGVREDGILLGEPAAGAWLVELDGEAAVLPVDGSGRRLLPAAWRQGHRLSVTMDGVALLGSPIRLDAIRRVEGFVERTAEGVAGWAWTPASPGLETELQLVVWRAGRAARTTSLTARELLPVDGSRPLARPRGFSVAVSRSCEVHVLGSDGRHLLGSPLPALGGPRRVDRGHAAALTIEPDLPVDVVIPVYRGRRTTLDCLDSVMGTVAPPHRIVVVDDASPEPELVAALDALAASGAIRLVRSAAHSARQGRGFPAAVNAGMQEAAGRHVVLLNSDTLVAPGWLETLRDAACSAPDIGTATPLSNEASIFSVPDPGGGNPVPDAAGTRALAILAARANAGRLVDVPTAHGFCMFIRRDCLAATGPFDAALFAQGYGEENDFCERARALGYRHVAVPAVYVAHRGGVSFGGAGGDLLRRNLGLLYDRHPDYAGRVAEFIAADRLFPARRRLDAARWRGRPEASPPGPAVLLVTHGGGGGTARIVAERAQSLREAGKRPIVVRAKDGRCEVGDAAGAYPNLAYVLPAELAGLRRLLAVERPASAELHHLLGHDHSILRLLASLGVPYDVWVHDYAWFCARLAFVTGEGQFCGEAPVSVCRTCLATWGRGIDDPIAPGELRQRSAADLHGARRIVVPSEDVRRRVVRHVPGVAPELHPWEEPPPMRRASVGPVQGRRRVAVIGAIGLEKGVRVLLACAEDATARGLALEFVVVGYTSEDAALLQTGRVFITGEFRREEATGLIAAQRAQLAFLPSIWPETWCYALSDAWAAGLSAAVFDIGTPAERIRAAGGGWVLPLGLPAARVNDVLLSL